MPKNAVTDWDTNADLNTDIAGISLAEGGMTVASVNNAIRTIMAQVASAGFLTTTTPVFADNVFFITGSADATKKLRFEVDGITTGTTRTATPPDSDFRIAALDIAQQTLTGGVNPTVKDLGALSAAVSNTITPNPGDRPIQKITNDHAGTIAPGSAVGAYILEILNTTGAGALTTGTWTAVKGDSFDTTTTSKFMCSCLVTSDMKVMTVTKVA